MRYTEEEHRTPRPRMTPLARKPSYSPNDWRRRKPATPERLARARRKRRLLRRVLSAAVLLGIAGILVGAIALAGLLSWASRDLPDPGKLITRTVPQSTKIFDRTGTHLLFELHGAEQRTWRPLTAIAPTVPWAVIAVEDHSFYSHSGVSIRGILRAAWVALRGGAITQGGSTITQQLVKNAILTPERTLTRKLKDILIAYQLEHRFTKDEILTLYLNEIPFGGNAYGIESASQLFFGKQARDLDLAESAMLAALPKAPTRLSPYGSHRDELIARTHLVLDLMMQQGYVTADAVAHAKAEDILAHIRPRREAPIAPHFVAYVRELLTAQHGERLVEQGGLTVTTSLDVDLQSKAEAAIAKYAKRNTDKYDATNAALVAIDPATGQILAMVGSKDFSDTTIDGQVNVAIRSRQPGSSFKPIVYAEAFALG